MSKASERDAVGKLYVERAVWGHVAYPLYTRGLSAVWLVNFANPKAIAIAGLLCRTDVNRQASCRYRDARKYGQRLG